MNTYKAELKNGKETETVVVESAAAGQVYGKLCAKKALDGYEIVNCYKGDHRSGSIYYDELIGLLVTYTQKGKPLREFPVEFGFTEEVDKQCKKT